jgi:hypothetical protein
MNENKLVGLTLLAEVGISYLLGSGKTGVTQSVTIPVTNRLVGFQSTQTPSGDIIALSTIEYTCNSLTPRQIWTNPTQGVPLITNSSSTK